MGIDRRTMLGACAAALSVAGAYGAMRVLTAGNMHLAAHDTVAARGAAGKADKYTCPMHPDVVKDGPGSCPICGMHLVKIADSGASGNTQLVHVDQQTQERMGVRVAAATESDMHRAVAGFAAISADESRAVSVNPRVEGWIRRMHVRGPGQAVRKGQLLYEIYSPELQQRQREYLDLLARRESLLENSNGMGAGNSAMLGSLAKERFRARDRLLAADMTPESVAALEKDRRVIDVVPVRAAHNGVVTSVSAREGSYVNPMQQILAYADTGSAWAEVTVFPDQLAWIRNGDVIVLTSPLDKSRTAQARVDLSALQVDPATRTAKLRLALSNTRGDFPPGTLAEASIRTGARRALTVPRDAVIRTGRGDFVVVSEGNGHFRSVKVATGAENEDAVEILNGIGRGTQVAVNGQFLLDAAASMQAMQGRMAANAARPRLDEHAAHRHHGKTHGGGHSS
ncbi:efflux RND transporter periplasmic adaptor subunit [Noviherbaspirillum sp.]|uniref:efflux RND transporter periplasmic adaptor subunit n=1 Tax=Noviherbaspirillum sp. TaxID=1926288 RepID=UPI002D74DB53|nr:efflux RND transporter periplasmic adaptor subunit [Noviherbaspirillum sp.]HZW20744.1 efflux RND transporter periplasmic adaptor subunit [Noviherbaspirillum sp.]